MACLSNLRQFGIAFVMYANDKEGYLPAGYTNLLCIRHDLRHVEPVRKSGVNFTVLPNPGGRVHPAVGDARRSVLETEAAVRAPEP